jgi:DNA mismatch repair protein MutS
VAERATELLATARALARLDVFASLAEVAHCAGHVRPSSIATTRSRSSRAASVLEARLGSPVTPNDLALDREARIVILTGPNMAGKSVYSRQTGAHHDHGAARRVRARARGADRRRSIAVHRVRRAGQPGAGQSTFLVEMVETRPS